ncbi:MAG: hypothetical protein AAFQ34_01815 [Pseudomonadota bacterium]
MRIAKHLGCLALATILAFAPAADSPAAAQQTARPIIATNVSFFEEVELGDLTLSPVNIFHDTRCADPELCFQNNEFAISVIMFTDEGLREVILRLLEPTKVPGGVLTLTDTGTPPSRSGAIELDRYRLELAFRPAPQQRSAGRTSGLPEA